MTYAQTTPNTAVLLRRNAMLATSLTQTAAPRRQANSALTVRPLTATDETEVLEFLAARPLHTVILVGFIRDGDWLRCLIEHRHCRQCPLLIGSRRGV